MFDSTNLGGNSVGGSSSYGRTRFEWSVVGIAEEEEEMKRGGVGICVCVFNFSRF